jgi:anionic cell wall polymer biosynthesis LytR-Cps2A-Psr (LCP) family protein
MDADTGMKLGIALGIFFGLAVLAGIVYGLYSFFTGKSATKVTNSKRLEADITAQNESQGIKAPGEGLLTPLQQHEIKKKSEKKSKKQTEKQKYKKAKELF